ncbi:MAG: chromosomal replication initiator protein DnaA [Candidatus Omnitrophica bacterium]|nr:chromosomal replication initiator protein DnaA [Candidatus Omnitrophota bacterium]
MTHDLLKAWERIQDYLRQRLGEMAYQTWVLPLSPKQEGEDLLILEAPDKFFCEWINTHYKGLFNEALKQYSSEPINLSLKSKAQVDLDSQAGVSIDLNKSKSSFLLMGSTLNPRYTFENFVVGPSNRHAYAYSLAVAESPARQYNPLFIYGGVGLGKTHLMQAICHYIRNKHPSEFKICYIPSERFTNELIEAIQHRCTAGFRQKYRNVDVLVIDDIHFIAGKESTQEEFFHTFNVLYDAHKQIIISSDRSPKEIANLQERLVSRFSWGLTCDIQPPDLETRIAILKKKIEREPVNVPDEVIFFIAQLIKTNIRELEGALIRVIAYSLLEEKPITLDLAKEVLKDLLKESKKVVGVEFIQRCVAEEFGLSLQDLKTKKRNKNIVLPRQIAMYLIRELTNLSFPEISKFFGGKDHTTIIHSYNKIKKVVLNNLDLKEKIDKITQLIKQ